MKPLLALLLAAAVLAGNARAEERILSFHSDIVVGADAAMEVTETLRVRGEQDRINHGIYRDFPTDYRDTHGNRVQVGFEPQSLTRDGQAEPFHTEGLSNGTRVYFGSKDVTLEPGEYTYVLRYRTTRQLGFFDDHDELYWNVTGNGWDFAIYDAGARVTLPGAVAPADLALAAYTGPQGSKGQDFTARADGPSRAVFETTRALAPREGLTIVVGFPKGIVAAPDAAQRSRWFLEDNAAVLVGGLGLVLLWIYYLVQWLRVGRDPPPGVIIPQYEAPEALSPGTLRYIERMGYDDRCLAADVVQLAVNGHLEIREAGKTWTLQRQSSGRGELDGVERTLSGGLFGGGETLALKQENHRRIAGAIERYRKELAKSTAGRYFNVNARYGVIGTLIALLALALGMVWLGPGAQQAGAWFMLVWLSFWSIGVFMLVAAAAKAWRTGKGVSGYIAAVLLTLFSLPFLFGEVAGIGMFAKIVGLGFAVVALALVLTNVAFFQWMKAPTLEGRRLLDRIEGLRLYLGVAERDELAAQKAPPMTAEEYQRFLPFALALGVEKNWTDRFAAAVGPAAAAAATTAAGWYHGSHAGDFGNLASSLGSSLSGAISSSSSAPGSSSGGGGGGSSGGGGGGGGGGGW